MKKRLSDLFAFSNKTIGNAQWASMFYGANKGELIKGEAIIFKRHLCGGMKYSDNSYEIRKDSIILTPAFDNGVLLKYAYYYLLANKDLWQRYYVGTSHLTNLSQIDLGMIEIDYPSLDIQKKIIDSLDYVLKAKEKRKKALRILPNFLPAYYRSIRGSYKYYWSQYFRVGDLIKESDKRKRSKEPHYSIQIIPTPIGLELHADKQYTFTVDKTKCNPYFLSVALNASEKLKSLSNSPFSFTYKGGRLLSAISELQLRLPEDEVQMDFENRYKQIEKLTAKMRESEDKLNRLFDMLLYSFLLRGQEFNEQRINLLSDNPLIVTTNKYTYDDHQYISSLKEYNDKRASLYDYLEKGTVKQYFDSETGKIKLVGRDTIHI